MSFRLGSCANAIEECLSAGEGSANESERKKRSRSAVTSGRKLFVDGDPNSAWSRRYHDLINCHVSDLGGAGMLSEAQKSLVRRASAIECELELMEGRLSMGETIDLDVFTRSASHLRRILETLGVDRKPRDVTLTLEGETLRKAVFEHVLVEAGGLGADREGEAGGGVMNLPRNDSQSSEVISITDPQQIKNWDAEHPAANGAFESSDRVDLGRGFFAVRDLTAGDLKTVWRCHDPAGTFVCNKATADAARQWFAGLYFPQDAA